MLQQSGHLYHDLLFLGLKDLPSDLFVGNSLFSDGLSIQAHHTQFLDHSHSVGDTGGETQAS